MTKILLVSDNNDKISLISALFRQFSYEIISKNSEESVFEMLQNGKTDLIIFDSEIQSLDLNILMRKIKIMLETRDIRSVLLVGKDFENYDLLKYANSYITGIDNERLLIETVKSELRLRENLVVLSKNNDDLAKSLYQLNVLYNTSIRLAGSLDKSKLTDIMLDGLNEGLGLSVSYILAMDEPNNIRLVIKSLYPLSKRLENAIKQSAIANFYNQFSVNLSIDDINVTSIAKEQFKEYDINVFSFDNLYSPIQIQDKFLGIVEVFRETDFSLDDTKCFTTLVKQVSLPLESAILYDEIKDKNKKLEKLERMKSDFISIISHELRTPLTVINNTLEIILNGSAGELTATVSRFLRLAKNNADRLSDIIRDLLDISRIEAGKMDFKFEKTNINITVELVKNTLENFAKGQGVEINLSLDKTLENVMIDTKRIEQVLTNLISNAIKFTTDGGQINITSDRMTKEEFSKYEFFDSVPTALADEYVRIAVADNGIGIEKENWHKVFDRFKQIENSLSRKVGGSGLGLAIAKQLIEAHKGLIWLDSKIESGTTFFIAIPIMVEKNEDKTNEKNTYCR